jgi:predicted unusual protein kinase regulating ubiquinone biosynthesis (AarF/ABC1/UbiB family)
VKGYLQQIIVDGFAHADPHPGNIHVMKTGKLALMDLGMVARFDDTMRQSILKLMIGLGENDAEEVTQVLLEISQYDPERINIQKYKKNILRKMQENQNKKAQDLQNGKTIIDINKISAQLGIKLPVELVSLAKILLNMDQIIAILAPDYNLQKTVRDYVKQLMKEHMWGELKTGDLLRNMLESKELLEKLPYRLNKISDDLAHHRFKIKMDVFDQNKFLLAVQKVANRITAGVIIAALIIGAALIMRIPSSWSIAGYPGFPVLLFIIAALIGFYLVYQILFRDENDKNDKINY